MEPREFVESVPGFLGKSKVEQAITLAWYLHSYKEITSFTPAQLRDVFRKAYVEPPDLAVYLPRLANKRPPQLRRIRDLFRVEEKLKQKLDVRYRLNLTTVRVASLLSSLPEKVPNLAERAFLSEALNCYRVEAYRAATVMMWNLAFDHLKHWLLTDQRRLSQFNISLGVKYPKKNLTIGLAEHFEELKESEVIEVAKHSGLISLNVTGILQEKLKRRNRAAHPSNINVTQAQADDTITDLVNNVVLYLT